MKTLLRHRRYQRILQSERLELRTVLTSLIGVDFDLSSDSPTNWTSADNSLTPHFNLIDEDGTSTDVDLSVSSNGSLDLGDASPPAAQIPAHANSLTKVDGNLWLIGGSTITLTWSDLSPNENYEIFVFGSDEF